MWEVVGLEAVPGGLVVGPSEVPRPVWARNAPTYRLGYGGAYPGPAAQVGWHGQRLELRGAEAPVAQRRMEEGDGGPGVRDAPVEFLSHLKTRPLRA
eukprot:7761419-Alexandrium_andersonii.AAC.1